MNARNRKITTLVATNAIWFAIGAALVLVQSSAEVVSGARAGFAANAEPGMLGLKLVQSDGRIVVELVEDGSPAASADVAPGSEILSVNGTAVTSPAAVEQAESPVQLRLRVGDRTRDVTLERISLEAVERALGLRRIEGIGIDYDREPVAVGQRLEEIPLWTLDGERVSVGGDNAGAVTLIAWKSTCDATIADLVAYNAEYAQGKMPGRTYGLTWAEDAQAVRRWVGEHGIDIPQIVLPYHSRLASRLGLYESDFGMSFPHVFELFDGSLVRHKAPRARS
ncbi:MAG: PDZ domain-containing protein [Candidatus Schekmanbacteria bacterium]|nr:PDZ domain-containing protein [Candidatus Schekmanbacteria bacterium]